MFFFKKILKRLFSLMGYRLIKEDLTRTYQLDLVKESRKNVAIVKQYTMLSFLKLSTLYEQAVFFEKNQLEGAFVECGVWKGGAIGMMALANLQHGKKRRSIYLFDSFDDICEPDPVIDGKVAVQDVEQLFGKKVENLTGELKPLKGIYDSRGGHGTIEICKELLLSKIGYDSDFLHFHKGWFQDSLPKAIDQIDKIAILRLDADWYSSTKVCLDFLFEKVISGGIIIIDDYGRYDGCKKAVDEFLSEKKINTFLNYANYHVGECRYFVKT